MPAAHPAGPAPITITSASRLIAVYRMRSRAPCRPESLKRLHGMSQLLGDRLSQPWEQFVTVLVVEPLSARSVPTVMEPVRAGRQPHLFHLRLSGQDKLRAAHELDRNDAVGSRVIHLVGVEVLEPLGNLAQGGIGTLAKLIIVHGQSVSMQSDRRYVLS